MITAALLAQFRLSLDDLIKAARAEAARRRSGAKRFVEDARQAGLKGEAAKGPLLQKCPLCAGTSWKPDEVDTRIAEMEAIAGVLENLKLGQTYAVASKGDASGEGAPAPTPVSASGGGAS